MAEKHQKLSLQPSAASRWLKCKASPGFIVQHADAIPDDSSLWAEEGTQAHALASKLLLNQPVDDAEASMSSYVQGYVEFVRSKVGPGDVLFVEQKVPLFYMPERNGYVDAAIIGPKSIYIADLKYGVGVSVEAKKNVQLAIYGLSFIESLINSGLYDSFDPNTLVTLAIYQPRARDNRVTRLWSLSLSELLDFCAEILATAQAIQADPLNQPFAPSEDACRFCPASGLCMERARVLLGAMPPEVVKPLESVLTLPDVGKMDVETLAKIVLAAKPLESFLESARKRAYGLLEGGTKVPGCKLVTGRGSRSWKDEKEAKRLLMLKFNVDDCAPRELVSVAQAEKLLAKITSRVGTRYANLIEDQIAKTEGKPTLVPDSDPRPAINHAALTEGLTNLDAPASETAASLLE